MRRTFCIFLMLASATPLLAQKKRVAILNFDYSTVHNYVSSIFGSNQDVGKGVADILVEKLVNGGQYSVIERKAIDKIMAEQNFSNSDRADSSTAAKIGKLLGVQYIVMGSITQFGRDDRQTNVGGIGRVTGRYGIGGIGKKESKAAVALSARLVNTDTGEIIVAATGKGESTRSGTSLLGAGGGSTAAGGAMYDMSSSNFGQTILGEAVHQAVNQLSQLLEGSANKLPTVSVAVDALVADVSGKTLIINAGSRAGLKSGDKLQVKRVGREVKDPASGKVIYRQEDLIGEVTINEVQDLSAVGTFSGAGAPKVGDAVKTP